MSRLLRTCVASVAFASLSISIPALAADMPVKAPSRAAAVVAPPPTWSGCYAGLHGGYGWGDADDVVPVGVPRNLSPDGYFAGGQLGCNWQTQQWVWGVEGDIAGANINDEAQFSGGVSPYITHKITALASIRARAGLANGPHLWYVTGGWGWARATRSTAFTAGPTFSGSAKGSHDGWVLGAGYEYMISQNWTAKLEYVYYDLGKDTYAFSAFGAPVIDLDLHTVKFGLNYKW